MDEWTLVRGVGLRLGLAQDAEFRQALDAWADRHGEWIGLGETRDWTTARGLFETDVAPRPVAPALAISDAVAETLSLDCFDANLLRLIVAADRLPRFSSLIRAAAPHRNDMPVLLADVAGAPPEDGGRALRRSAIVRMGLVSFSKHRGEEASFHIGWALDRLLDAGEADKERIVEILIGRYRRARLELDAFSHVADADFLVRLLRGAAATRAAGINILIYGPVGTGKTELAATLAKAADLPLHTVGEADEDGDEPTRGDRLAALQLALRLVGGSGKAALLFDEFEDVIGDAQPSMGDWLSRRQGSKVFVNRLLETNATPIIWTTNAIGNVDDAILRRMSFVLKLDVPPPAAARRMVARVAAEEGTPQDGSLAALVAQVPETATVLRVATRAARIADDTDGGTRAAAALVKAVHRAEIVPQFEEGIDLDLFESDPPIQPLLERLSSNDDPAISFLLSGPPGTGKTILAQALARALDRPLAVKRASDLLSPWVGYTEKAIAAAFAEARERGQVLLFDEVDSILFDRATASKSWETTQVNEMLTWLDRHPAPVIAATNHIQRLDPAALRRFVFKISLGPLGRDRAALAFTRFFGQPAPASLDEIGNLTPGDFAAVVRQLRHAPARSPSDLADRLRQEAAWRPEGRRIGF